ncbi:peptidoglycan DD-metalloendopeptidase family protein [Roseivirga sp.]|uniref:peptidoglycan DD-metalloendopeptidase family protein n=1 Tax=Roseivirga sp. TaxID=1964215 RepID=UPI003B8D8551
MLQRTTTACLCLAIFLVLGCENEKVPIPFKPRNDHEAYEHALEEANLLSTALGADWKKGAKTSLESPIKITSPFEEAIYVDDKEAVAIGYQFNAKRGQKVQVNVEKLSLNDAKTFVDLFRIDEHNKLHHVATADSEELLLGFEPRRDATYVLRFQPELLRGGEYKITIQNVPTLQFPVAGKTDRAIGSFWGADRDGGRRKHEGVDIFAPRGTPIIAPTDGYVRTAGKRGIGGNVVWLYDSKRSQSLYFAHLNKILVKKGDRIKLGDTLGTVGNTGNARTTPPHLHFGIYKNGATDPINHLRAAGNRLKPVTGDLSMLGQEVRINRSTSMSVDANGKQTVSITKNQIARTIGTTATQFRIELPNGQEGYVRKSVISGLDRSLERLYASSDGTLLKSPDRRAFLADVEPNDQLYILGKNRDFWLVENDAGQKGWITNNYKNQGRSRRSYSDEPR